MLSLIVAKAENNVIGKDNKMPWHLPQDLQYFKAKTLGKPIVMGRKTFESLGRVLPGRPHIIITRNAEYQAPDNCYVVSSLGDALEQALRIMPVDQHEAVVIGGAQIYSEALAIVDRLYVTEVGLTPEGDTFFPEIDPTRWQSIESIEGEGDIPHRFVTYNKCQ